MNVAPPRASGTRTYTLKAIVRCTGPVGSGEKHKAIAKLRHLLANTGADSGHRTYRVELVECIDFDPSEHADE